MSTTTEPARLISRDDASKLLGVSLSTLIRHTHQELITKPVRIGASTRLAWPGHELDAYQQAYAAQATAEELRTLTARFMEKRAAAREKLLASLVRD